MLPRAQQLAQPCRGFLPVDARGGDVEDELFPDLAIRCGFDSVEAQEHDRCGHCGALVPVDERMVAAQVEQIRRGDFFEIGKRRLAAEGGLGGSDGGFEKSTVPDARGAAECGQYLSMDLQNHRNGKVNAVCGRRAHARRRSVLR